MSKFKEIRVDKGLYLNQIKPFSESGIPANSFIFKGRCGIGGTTLELNQHRHSIIIVPTVSPIQGKLKVEKGNECKPHDEIFPLFGGKNFKKGQKLQMVMDYLESDVEYKKIFSTPESFQYVIEGAKQLGKLEWLKENFFLLLDECHSFVVEKFRKGIRSPFKHFWDFKNKALISATPFIFSDPKFDQLDRYEITFFEELDGIEMPQTLGKILLAETDNVRGTLDYILNHPEEYKGNVHIFYNSVKNMAEAVRFALLNNPDFDCNLFCAESDTNLMKLDDVKHFFKQFPEDYNYKKINIYTSKMFEAWDLFDNEDATIILLTDIIAENTKVGIAHKGVQAVGRFRIINGVEPHKIIHITNTRDTQGRESIENIYRQVNLDAVSITEAYNKNITSAKEEGLLPRVDLKDSASQYGDIDEDTELIEIDPTMIDQWANIINSDQAYNNIGFIKEAWEKAHYGVEVKSIYDYALENIYKKTVSQKIKIFCEQLDILYKAKDSMLFPDSFKDSLERLQGDYSEFGYAFKAFHKLGMAKLQELKFDKTAIKLELFEILKEETLEKVRQQLPDCFKTNQPYTRKEIKEILQDLYEYNKYCDKHEKTITAKATDLKYLCCVDDKGRIIKIVSFTKPLIK